MVLNRKDDEMIIENICDLLFGLCSTVIGLCPNLDVPSLELAPTATLLGWALNFFPPSLWGTIILSIGFWYGIQMTWAIIEWVYKKIPGVD